MLHLQNLSKDFGGNILFGNISWHLKRGERVGLVGDNGAGKSTLMRILAGKVEAASGSVQMARGAVIGHLEQDAQIPADNTLFAEVMTAFADLRKIEHEILHIAEAMHQMGGDIPADLEMLQRYGELQEEFRAKGGYAMEAEAGIVLSGLGFPTSDWERSCSEFSGGWRMRIALSKLLLQKPHVLLLDEPTNHLDIDARNWLEEYLRGYPYSVILVSHDRYFMDQVCHRITEIWNCCFTDYHCNYSNYLLQREERVARLREAKRRQDEEIAKIEDFVSRFRSKADKASLVQSRIRQLDKIERVVLPPERKHIFFNFPLAPRSGRIVLQLSKATKGYGGRNVLQNVDLTVERGERISIVGQNGAGKSTLMHVMAGAELQEGERVLGANVSFDYFAQNQSSFLDDGKTIYEELLADAPLAEVPRLRDLLGAFLFSGDDIHKRVGVLSGGEKNRLALAKMLLRPSNLLLLDEPTNHLDLMSKEILLEALKKFSGSIVFVSHDRHFVDSLATRVVEVKDGNVSSYQGNYGDYLECVSANAAGGKGICQEVLSASQGETASAKNDRMRKREEDRQKQRENRARQKKIEEIEALIEQSEHDLRLLEEKMSRPEFFRENEIARSAAEEHGTLTQRISGLYHEWESMQVAESV